MKKLYVVVRGDLPEGAQIAQSCHAVSAYAVAFPEAHRDWHQNGQNLVVLSVPNEAQLRDLLGTIELVLEIVCAPFNEPDLGGQMTAFAVPDLAAKQLASLPLALRASRCPYCKETDCVTICARCAA